MNEPAPLHRLRLAGDPAFQLAGGPLVALEGRAAALAALVALEPGISRQRVATLLWPDSQDPRRNLRQQLLRLRQQAGLSLVDGDDRLALAPGVQLDADAAGVLLAGHAADDSDFGRWLEQQRQQHATQRRAAVQSELRAAEEAGDLQAALQRAQAQARLDPDDEQAQRDLMRLHYLRGEGAAGLAVYQALQQRLARQYGARPQPATQALATTLMRAEPVAAPGPPPAPMRAVTLQRPPALVGRAADLARLHEAWDRGQACLLQGEAGIGKTRLLAEFTRGRTVAAVAGRPGDAGIPYATLARLLRPLLATDRLTRADRRALAQALPELVDEADAGTPPGPAALQAGVARLLQHGSPQAVLVDDLHFADSASLELLFALVGAGQVPVRWLLAERPHERSEQAAAPLRTLLEADALVLLGLQPLQADDLDALVDSLDLPGLASGQIGPALFRHTGGNALFALETLKLGLADGSLAQGRLPSPQRVGSLIEQRLRTLSEGALTLARVAAIAGVDFSIELAESVIGRSAVQLATAWAELEAAQVLRDQAFAHDLVADAVLRTVPAPVARRLHAQCAHWLAAQGGTPGRLAWHWRHAGHHAEAARSFVQAAEQASAASRALEQAALLLEAAADFRAAGNQPARFQALADRVRALTHEDAGDSGLQAVAQLHAEAVDDAQRLRAGCVEVELLGHRGRCAEAVDKGLPLVAQARRLGAMDQLVFVARAVAGSLGMLNRHSEALSLLQPLQAWVQAHNGALDRAAFLGYLASALGGVGRQLEALRVLEEALTLERGIDHKAELVVTMINLAIGYAQVGRTDLAVRQSAEGLALSVELGDESVRTAISLYTHARHLGDWGHHGAALQHLQAALPLLQSDDLSFWRETALLQMAANWIRLGQFARAQRQLQAFDPPRHARLQATHLNLQLEMAAHQGQPLRAELATLACERAPGDQDAGLVTQVTVLRVQPPPALWQEASRLASLAGKHERFALQAAAQVWMADAAARLGRHDDALAAARAARDRWAEGYGSEGLHVSEAHARVWLALQAVGARDEAEQALRDGVAWIQQHALPQVPPEFVESYLHRNTYNRQLLAAASRL